MHGYKEDPLKLSVEESRGPRGPTEHDEETIMFHGEEVSVYDLRELQKVRCNCITIQNICTSKIPT